VQISASLGNVSGFNNAGSVFQVRINPMSGYACYVFVAVGSRALGASGCSCGVQHYHVAGLGRKAATQQAATPTAIGRQ